MHKTPQGVDRSGDIAPIIVEYSIQHLQDEQGTAALVKPYAENETTLGQNEKTVRIVQDASRESTYRTAGFPSVVGVSTRC